jgi:hypothetical protein
VLRVSMSRFAIVLSAAMLLNIGKAGAQPSQSLEPDSADALLDALKHALVDAAQGQSVNVISSAYIDSSGQLVESNFFDTQATVRGVRVLEYLPSPSPAAANDRAVLPASLQEAREGVCAVNAPTKYRPTLIVSSRLELGEGRVNPALSEQITQAARALMGSHEALNSQWELVHEDPLASQLSQYDRLLTGKVAFDEADYELRWTLSAAPAVGSSSIVRRLLLRSQSYADSARRYLANANPLLPIRAPAIEKAVTLNHHVSLVNRRSGDTIQDIRFEDILASDTPELRNSHGEQIAAIVAALEPQLDNFFSNIDRDHACQLRQIPLVIQSGEPTSQLQMMVGEANDAELGDRFLLIETPWQGGQQTLNTNLVGSLSIGEIVSIDRYHSKVQVIAGKGTSADLRYAVPF